MTIDHRIIPDVAVSPGEALAQVFGDESRTVEFGKHFTCTEADLIAVALRDLREHQAAITFLMAHAGADDDPLDIHYYMAGDDVTEAVLRQHTGEYLDQL